MYKVIWLFQISISYSYKIQLPSPLKIHCSYWSHTFAGISLKFLQTSPKWTLAIWMARFAMMHLTWRQNKLENLEILRAFRKPKTFKSHVSILFVTQTRLSFDFNVFSFWLAKHRYWSRRSRRSRRPETATTCAAHLAIKTSIFLRHFWSLLLSTYWLQCDVPQNWIFVALTFSSCNRRDCSAVSSQVRNRRL